MSRPFYALAVFALLACSNSNYAQVSVVAVDADNATVEPDPESDISAAATPMITRTHDLSEAIEAHQRAKSLSFTNARTMVLRELMFIEQQHAGVKRKQVGPATYEITAPETYHNQLAGFTAWIAEGRKQITVEIRVLTLSDEQRRNLHTSYGDAWEFNNSGEPSLPQPPSGSFSPRFELDPTSSDQVFASSTTITQKFPIRTLSIDESQLKDLLTEVQSQARSNVMMAPKVTLFPRQTATVKDTSQRPFVTSVKRVRDDKGTAVLPVITVLDEGFSMELNANIDEGRVKLASDLTLGKIIDVEEFTFGTNSEEGVTVQIPKLHQRNVTAQTTLAPGTSLLIDPHFFTEVVRKRRFRSDITSQNHMFFILTPRIIDSTFDEDAHIASRTQWR